MAEAMGLSPEILKELLPGVSMDRGHRALDMDDITLNPGVWRTDPTTLNIPEGIYGYGLLRVDKCTWTGNLYIVQDYTSHRGERIFRIYWTASSGWGPWRKIETTTLIQ